MPLIDIMIDDLSNQSNEAFIQLLHIITVRNISK